MENLFGEDFSVDFDSPPSFSAPGVGEPSVDFSAFLNFEEDVTVPTANEFFDETFGSHDADMAMTDLNAATAAHIALAEAGLTTNSNTVITGDSIQIPEINFPVSLTAIKSIQLTS